MNFNEVILKENKIISLESDKIYCLSEGTVQLWELHDDGTEILINILKEGDALKLPTFNFNSIYELRSNKGAAEILIYNWNSIQRIEEKYFLLNKINSTLMRNESLNLIKRTKFVKDRLISLLQLLAQEYGERGGNKEWIIKVSLTHEQLASLILSTRATVTKILSELKREKLVKYFSGCICLNEEYLNSMCSDFRESA